MRNLINQIKNNVIKMLEIQINSIKNNKSSLDKIRLFFIDFDEYLSKEILNLMEIFIRRYFQKNGIFLSGFDFKNKTSWSKMIYWSKIFKTNFEIYSFENLVISVDKIHRIRNKSAHIPKNVEIFLSFSDSKNEWYLNLLFGDLISELDDLSRNQFINNFY